MSRLIGSLFLSGFLLYGTGSALVASLDGGSNFLSTISDHRSVLALGAFLMLLNTAVDIGKAVLLFPLLEQYNRRIALAYLATMIIEVVLLDVGVLCLLMLAPISQQATGAGGTDVSWLRSLGALAIESNAMAYQFAEIVLGVGCVVLFSLLYRVRLIPRALSTWGVLGYVVLTAGMIAELFGAHVGLALSIPGGLLEVTLGIWLLTKGFDRNAYGEPNVKHTGN